MAKRSNKLDSDGFNPDDELLDEDQEFTVIPSDELEIDEDIVALKDDEDEEETTEVAPTAAKIPKAKGEYIRNKDLLPAVREARELGYMTDKLAKMLVLLCNRYATHYRYSGYSYNDEMRSHALWMLVRSWHGFNPDKGSNPFAYYTQCIKNSFKQYLNYEKRISRAKDELLIRNGLNPSSAYTGEETADSDSSYDQYDNH